MSTVIVIPIRKGSKGITEKNLTMMAGKPLYRWVYDAALEVDDIEKVVITTNYTGNESRARDGVFPPEDGHVLLRPDRLCKDDSPTEPALLHFALSVDFDDLIVLQATNPQTTTKQIEEAYDKFKTEELDSLLSVTKAPEAFYWMNCNGSFMPMNYKTAQRPRRQDGIEPLYVENGAIYIVKRKILEDYQARLGGQIGIYEMPLETATEIDSRQDWEKVECVLLSRGA